MTGLAEAAAAKVAALTAEVEREEASVERALQDAARSKQSPGDYWSTLHELRERLRVAKAVLDAVGETGP